MECRSCDDRLKPPPLRGQFSRAVDMVCRGAASRWWSTGWLLPCGTYPNRSREAGPCCKHQRATLRLGHIRSGRSVQGGGGEPLDERLVSPDSSTPSDAGCVTRDLGQAGRFASW